MHFRVKTFFQNSLLAFLLSSVIMLMVYTVRTIIDPMDNNPELFKIGEQIFNIFIWPYKIIESNFIGYEAGVSYRVNLLWTPIGILLNLLWEILFIYLPD
jgi:hypothetical protein